MTMETPYLNAIQAIPGSTPGEKFRWIGNLIKERLSECNNLEDVVESEKIPRQLAPLVQVQAAIMLNKKDRENQGAYSAIAEALKSKDQMVVNKALQAATFFDGTNKIITNTRYFFENLFPYVSLNTRLRIIKTLAVRLAPKNSDLAEEFFTAVASFYNLEQALPLLPACSESFIYDTIVQRRIDLSRKLVKQIFRKNPDIIVRYFRLSKPSTDLCVRNIHQVKIYKFTSYLAALIKKRLDSFVELYEMHEQEPPEVTLSIKRAEAFLKNGKEHLLRKPKLYVNLLPLKMISSSLMETIFVKLFPKSINDFRESEMLNYLAYYPQDKKSDLFLRSYQQAYGKNILDDPCKVTETLMDILPAEERIKQARIKLEPDSSMFSSADDYMICWQTYLPVEESIPLLKTKMAMTSEMELRSTIACKMIFSCKLNNDDQALLEVLRYLSTRHKNEQPFVQMAIFEILLRFYDVPQMGKDFWAILMEMIMRAHVKEQLITGDPNSERILEAAIHYKIIQNQPFEQLINIFLELKIKKYTFRYNILQKYPGYERMFLEACLNVVSQKYDSELTMWKKEKTEVLYSLCNSIYYFNEVHVNKTSRIERMSIKNYPWLLRKVEEFLTAEKKDNDRIYRNLQCILRQHEKDIYARLWPKEQKSAEIKDNEVFKLLRRSPETVLESWKEYYEYCDKNWYRSNCIITRFVRTIRWYKDIPVKFAEQSLQDLAQKKNEVSLQILAILLHGDTLAKIIEPLIPINKSIEVQQEEARRNYFLITHAMYSIKLTTPPIPLTILSRLCDGEYLSITLSALTNVCRRTNMMDVISFARMLTSQKRPSIWKHGIRLMDLVAPMDQLLEFLRAQWEASPNHSIRKILFAKVVKQFQNNPGPVTWSLFSRVITTLPKEDRSVFSNSLSLLKSIPDEYVVHFLKLALNTIDRFEAAGVDRCSLEFDIHNVLMQIDAAVCNLLPEDIVRELIRRYLFHKESEIALCASVFVIMALQFSTGDQFEDRMRVISNTFTEMVNSGWDVPHPKNPYFYPVNNSVRNFVDNIVHAFYGVSVELRVIDAILSTFLAVLKPQMDATSYLLLLYTKVYASSKTPKEFGTKLVQMMPELIDTFSTLLVFFMADKLEHVMNLKPFKDYDPKDANLEVIEGLIEDGSIETALMAMKLLDSVSPKDCMDRYLRVMKKLTEYDHPGIRSIVCNIKNKECDVD